MRQARNEKSSVARWADLRFTGAATPFLWAVTSSAFTRDVFLAFTLGAAVVLAVLLALSLLIRWDGWIRSPWCVLAGGALTLVPEVVLLASGNAANDAPMWCWGFGGGGFAIMFAQWFLATCLMEQRFWMETTAVGLGGAYLLRALVLAFIGIPLAGDVLLTICTVASTIALAGILHTEASTHIGQELSGDSQSVNQTAGEPLPSPGPAFLVGLTIPFALMAFYLGFSHMFPMQITQNSPTMWWLSVGLGLVFSGAILWWLWMSAARGRSSLLAQSVVLIVAATFLVALFYDREQKLLLMGFQVAIHGTVFLLVWLLAHVFARRGTFATLPVFSSLMGLYLCMLCAGVTLYSHEFIRAFLETFPQEGVYLFCAVAAVAVVICVLIVSGFHRELLGQGMHETVTQSDDQTDVSAVSDASDRLAQLVEEHHLSAREQEIMELLAKGRSRPYIAETLYLSENTVKWYCRQIYQKMGVANKQELISLVNDDRR